ncbi:hydroxymethylglutaryl-CoA lyase [Microlunatus sp. Gsoil 973]|uniref:hydroxymethylglutaryl-CoA lyase n=1 Tax=Microlunatus sp. Gsoil 973 TaxID=2672569 RepID=UPI0012B44243|nr:hydroxymethylglutaryl-CoA lyase [Microlunatus sp. Gsoil 973]QGN32999.1 hydroxymethylglutaryl-CoA lyase [Microlunatus sp. Gsoil 973]
MVEHPDVFPLPGLPGEVTIYEVGPRDGLQAEKQIVDTRTKIEFIRRLRQAGLTAIEATSFVSPRWVPQLADANQVLAGIGAPDGYRHPVLVPNQKGMDRALEAGATEIAVFVSATERFAKENLATTVDGAIEMAAPVVRQAAEAGIPVRGYVSMCFGDPWEGRVPLGQVVSVTRRLADLGVRTISLGDTIGVGTPGHVRALLESLGAAGIGMERLALHFHDTYGGALANVLSGLQCGVSEYDSSAGGIGGCQFARSATGNLATEDLVWMLTGLGIRTGVDLDRLIQISGWMAGKLGRPAPSRVVAALYHDEVDEPLF